jgi:hypothetical protein
MTGGHSSTLAAIEARVAEQPWRTLAGAFLLGAWVGFSPPRAPRNPLTRAVFAMIGSVALRAIHELALREFLGRTPQPMPEDQARRTG